MATACCGQAHLSLRYDDGLGSTFRTHEQSPLPEGPSDERELVPTALFQRHRWLFRLEKQAVKQANRLLDFFPVHEPGDPERRRR
jgi:hypothetical protein